MRRIVLLTVSLVLALGVALGVAIVVAGGGALEAGKGLYHHRRALSRMAEPVSGNEVLLERFPNYWNAELPYVDRLSASFHMSAEEILDAFLRRELDYVSDLPLTNLAELRERPDEIHLIEAVQLQTRMLVFDCERPPFADKRVRQAICYAIDREKFLREVYGHMAEPAVGQP